MAGDESVDQYWLGGNWTWAAMVGGLIRPINDFVDPSHDVLNEQMWLRAGSNLNGVVYSFRNMGRGGTSPPIVGVNLDIINAMGLDDPRDLYYSGQWTMEKMREMMIEATISTDGTGVINQWGWGGSPTSTCIQILGGHHGYFVYQDAAGDYLFGFDLASSQAGLEYLYQMFAVDRIYMFDDEGFNYNFGAGDATLAWLDGRALFWNSARHQYGENDIAFNFTVVPVPFDPIHNPTHFVGTVGWAESLVMPVMTQGAEDLIHVYMNLFNWMGHDVELRDGPWFNTLITHFQDERDWPRMSALGENPARHYLDFGNFLNLNQRANQGWMMNRFFYREHTVASYIESVRNIYQDMINEMFYAD
jgi:hypothetical protein